MHQNLGPVAKLIDESPTFTLLRKYQATLVFEDNSGVPQCYPGIVKANMIVLSAADVELGFNEEDQSLQRSTKRDNSRFHSWGYSSGLSANRHGKRVLILVLARKNSHEKKSVFLVTGGAVGCKPDAAVCLRAEAPDTVG